MLTEVDLVLQNRLLPDEKFSKVSCGAFVVLTC